MVMTHVKFPSITNHYQDKFLDKIKAEHPKECLNGKWVVMEKIHGANYSFWVDFYHQGHAYVKAAKRTDFLEKGEAFYGHEEVFKRLSYNMYLMAKEEKRDLVIYGELFGGSYNGEQKGCTIQKGTQYHPYNEFLAFDIAHYQCGKLAFYGHNDFMDLCQEFYIPHAPVLFEGTLEACLNFNNEFQTNVPKLYGLPDIEGNICEGVIIKPETPLFLKNGDRVILKSKNEKFSEVMRENKPKINESVFSEEVLSVITKANLGLTDNRMDAIVSKHGEDMEFSHAMKELLEDAAYELCRDEWNELSEDQHKVVRKALSKAVADIVKRKINLKKKVS